MNILVIGNGFDIEHGIPSSYKNFLDFIRAYRIVYKNRNSLTECAKKNFKDELGKISIQYKESNFFLKEMKIANSYASEFGEAINNNCGYGISWRKTFGSREKIIGLILKQKFYILYKHLPINVG